MQAIVCIFSVEQQTEMKDANFSTGVKGKSSENE
jgi:hypothetical protein